MSMAMAVKRLGTWPLLCGALLACGAPPARAGSANGVLTSDTFINSAHPDNNNGGANLIYLGNDLFYGGYMRGLVRFNLPTNLAGRATVTGATLSMTTAQVNTVPFSGATVYLERLTEGWSQGSGAALDPYSNLTVGSPCSSGAGGATWNQPTCSGVLWSTPGGSVAGVSGSAFVPATVPYTVQWSSTGMNGDVQGWLDTPSGNYGWRLRSSTEPPTPGGEQAFTKNPTLSVTYACKSGFLDTGTYCSACTVAAKSACVASQAGNTCNDSGPPSQTYSCTCANAAYTLGPGGTSCVDKNECIPNHCTDRGDTMAVCTDHVAPATGYSCTCDAGFHVSGGTCIDVIFADGFGP